MADEARTPPRPPWNWKVLPKVQLEIELEELADWVADLQEAYGRWVRLPNCWPCHRALLAELAAFWYWRLSIDGGPGATAEESVRWHQSLRASAQAWAEAFGGCTHHSLGEVDEQRDGRAAALEASRPYLALALDALTAARPGAAPPPRREQEA